MTLSWLDHLLLAVGLLGLSTALPGGEPSASAALNDPQHRLESSELGSLAGGLLVASPEIGDRRFARTVILLVRQDRAGAFGIVINRPVGWRSVASLLEAAGAEAKGAEGSAIVFAGGPVEPETGFVLHSAEYHRPETVTLGGGLALTSSPDILLDIGRGKGPRKSLIAFGYAGWAAGQLERELARHEWFTAPADPALVFDEVRARVWEVALRRRTLEL